MNSSAKKRVVKECTCNFSDFQKQEAIDIFLDDEVSYSLPDVKYCHLYFMSCTISDVYNKHYLAKSTSKQKMGQSTFTALKPLFVRSISEMPLQGCKCEYCQNLGLIRDTLIALAFKGIPKKSHLLNRSYMVPVPYKRRKRRKAVKYSR